MKCVIILSGGADSSTLAYFLKNQGFELLALTFDYGQKSRIEIDCARKIAAQLNIEHHVLNLADVGKLLKGNSLTDSNVEFPNVDYHDDMARLDIVPARNMLMLTIAWSIAVANDCQYVTFGSHKDDNYIFPDTRPCFVEALGHALELSTTPYNCELVTPFAKYTKLEIINIGLALGVPYEMTWTCYDDGVLPCGKCAACSSRELVFKEAGVPDPLIHNDCPSRIQGALK